MEAPERPGTLCFIHNRFSYQGGLAQVQRRKLYIVFVFVCRTCLMKENCDVVYVPRAL